MPDKQITRLKEELQTREFKKLDATEGKAHRATFDNQKFKDQLRAEWERETEQEWPTYKKVNPRTGLLDDVKYDMHHIIQNNHSGPHEWWNIHPAFPKEHSLIHRAGGLAKQIFDAK